jgi:hypothetical protein
MYLSRILQRTRYLNAVNTLSELLSMGVVPIINENDTISVSVRRFSQSWLFVKLTVQKEIKFGDNDTLSAIASSMLHADYLFLLTDVDSLYTANPRKDPSARAIEVVENVSAIRTQGIFIVIYLHLPELICSVCLISEYCNSGLQFRYRGYGDQTYCCGDCDGGRGGHRNNFFQGSNSHISDYCL